MGSVVSFWKSTMRCIHSISAVVEDVSRARANLSAFRVGADAAPAAAPAPEPRPEGAAWSPADRVRPRGGGAAAGPLAAEPVGRAWRAPPLRRLAGLAGWPPGGPSPLLTGLAEVGARSAVSGFAL